MAEAIAVASSIIAIIQITDRVVGLCKFYIETVHGTPSDLRRILNETSTMKTSLENIQFLISCNNASPGMLDHLSGPGGPIEGCLDAIAKIEGLFPSDCNQGPNGCSSKRQKFKASLKTLAWGLKENKARKLVDELIGYKTTISFALVIESTNDTKDIKNKTSKIHDILSESQREMVYKWLQDTDPSSLHHRALKLYESETGDWMLRSPEWQNWIEGTTRCVWVHGIAGAGKTVFASHLIEKTKEHCEGSATGNCVYVYYYCYFGHSQDEAAPFLRWTIARLCREADAVPSCLYKLYKHNGEPSLVDLLRALEAVLEAFDKVYLVIDAIDESMPRDDLLRVIRDLATDSRFQRIQLLATSREYIDIEKVMQQVSVSVSMSNPLVDEDIKRYVLSRLHTNSKFSHWTLDLRTEAVEALSAKAKGMFRWAACQRDVLQRLKGESTIVKNALANLPKTLDETYERVFLGIPEEDRMFVLHALKWIHFNGELFNENISCSIVLQAIERSTYDFVNSERDYFYDEERLRDLCGCLITVTPQEEREPGRTVCTVSFAHYTVWEFLNSPRIMKSPAAFFALTTDIESELTRIVILEVINSQPNDFWDWEECFRLSESDKIDVDEHSNSYCVLSSILCLLAWNLKISRQSDLTDLVFRLLDPMKPHFRHFSKTATQINESSGIFADRDVNPPEQFWKLEWKPAPERSSAAILINLLLLDESFALARSFLEKVNIQEVLQTRLDFQVDSFDLNGEFECVHYNFKGSIIEFFAQFALFLGESSLKILLELCAESFDFSRVLLSFIGSHKENCTKDCILLRLLRLGANANVSGYIATPLQIAVAC